MLHREKPDHFFPFYVADFLADTMHLTAEDVGVYLLILCAYWRNQGPLQDDNDALASIARMARNKWRKKKRKIIAQFFQISDGLWSQKRMNAELKRAAEIMKVRREAGKIGGDASARSRANAQASAAATVQRDIQQRVEQRETPLHLHPTLEHKDQEEGGSSPSRSAPTPMSDDDARAYHKICELLGYDALAPVNRTAFINLQTVDGLDPQAHLLPAARDISIRPSHAHGKNIGYLRARALEIKACPIPPKPPRRMKLSSSC